MPNINNGYCLIEERRASVAYKVNGQYRKYLKYGTIGQAEFENNMQILFRKYGINTSRCIGFGFDSILGMPYVECEYCRFDYIGIEKLKDSGIREQLINIINRIRNINTTEIDSIREDVYYADLLHSLCYVDNDVKWNERLLSMKTHASKSVCHGDFTLDNLALNGSGEVVLFDFQHVSICDDCWDLAFFIASLPYDIGRLLIHTIDKQLLKLIQLAAAVRYGRGNRKSLEVKFRKANYEYWKEYKV